MKDFSNSYLINAEPEVVFAALTNPLTIEIWSGYPAVMKAEPGTEFSLWDGDITGINREIVPGEKIVQEWDFGEQEEVSIVEILLKAEGDKTRIHLVHKNIPGEAFGNIAEGWNKYYFGALKDFYK